MAVGTPFRRRLKTLEFHGYISVICWKNLHFCWLNRLNLQVLSMFALTLGRRIIFALKQQVWVQAPFKGMPWWIHMCHDLSKNAIIMEEIYIYTYMYICIFHGIYIIEYEWDNGLFRCHGNFTLCYQKWPRYTWNLPTERVVVWP